MPTEQRKIRKRTIKLYRLNEDGRRLQVATIQAGSPLELVTHLRAFLATAARGVYVAHYRGHYRGSTLALEEASEAAHVALAA